MEGETRTDAQIDAMIEKSDAEIKTLFIRVMDENVAQVKGLSESISQARAITREMLQSLKDYNELSIEYCKLATAGMSETSELTLEKSKRIFWKHTAEIMNTNEKIANVSKMLEYCDCNISRNMAMIAGINIMIDKLRQLCKGVVNVSIRDEIAHIIDSRKELINTAIQGII